MTPALQVIDLITTDESKKFAPAGRMAAAIIRATYERGDCLSHDLHKLGFTASEISQHWHMANALAAVELKLMAKNKITKSWWRKRNA